VLVVRRVFLTSTLLLALAAPAGAAGQSPPAGGELHLRADRLVHEQGDDILRADGNVELVWSGSTLYADMVTYLREAGMVKASGGVKLLKDGDVLNGDRLSLEVASRTGLVENGHMFVKKNNLHLRGAQIAKTGEQDYRLQQGSITSCDGDKPSWRFLVDDLKITMDDFATGRNAFFYLGDTPVFWMPYILFPVKTERQSGFFFPKFGNSSKKGVYLDLPYYWAISPSSDATFDLDLQSKRGVGIGVEHRYLSSAKGHGENHGYLIFDTQQDRFRGDLGLKQQVNFSPDTYWRADVNLALDRDFYRDYGVSTGEYNRQYLGTTAFLAHRLGNSLLATAGVDYLNDLQADNNRFTLQKLPYLSLMGSGQRIGSTPFYYSFTSSLAEMQRDTGGSGQRLMVSPRLTYAPPLGEWLGGRLWAGYGERVYHADVATETGVWQARGGAEGGVVLGSQLARTFDVSLGGMTRLQHLMIPELSYEFRETQSDADIPFFDYDDRPATGQVLTLSLQNQLTGKTVKNGLAEYRELLRLTLSQGYQLSGERRDLLVLADEGRPFADTRLKAEILPLPALRLFGDLRVSPYSGTLTNASLGLDGGEAKGNRLGIGWHHAKDRLDYLEGRFTLMELRPFTLSALGRYSFDKPGFLETLYSVEYQHQCWSFNLTYRERPGNNELTFNFTLAGLGPLGPLRAF
jgi:LPS-assembly protein